MNPIFYIWRKSVTFKPRQDKTRHEKAWQGKAKRGQTRPDEAAPRQEGAPYFLRILKINNLIDLNCLKFVYNLNKGELPSYFLDFRYEQRSSIHDHDTRFANFIDSKLTRTVMAQNCILHHIVTVLNCTPKCILDKIDTHSLQGFTFYIKRYYLDQMTFECSLRQCYICNMQSQS